MRKKEKGAEGGREIIPSPFTLPPFPFHLAHTLARADMALQISYQVAVVDVCSAMSMRTSHLPSSALVLTNAPYTQLQEETIGR